MPYRFFVQIALLPKEAVSNLKIYKIEFSDFDSQRGMDGLVMLSEIILTE